MRRKRADAHAHANGRRLSFDHGEDMLPTSTRESQVVRSSEVTDAPPKKPLTAAVQRTGPATTFDQILEGIQRVPTALRK